MSGGSGTANWLASAPASKLPLYAGESEQHARGRELQRLLLQAHLDQRGDGDAGPALAVTGPDGVTQRHTHRRLSTRTITTIFGPVQIERLGYSQTPANALSFSGPGMANRTCVTAALRFPAQDGTGFAGVKQDKPHLTDCGTCHESLRARPAVLAQARTDRSARP